MTQALLVTRLIFALNVPKTVKAEISACVFYGVQKSENIELLKRFYKCKRKVLREVENE